MEATGKENQAGFGESWSRAIKTDKCSRPRWRVVNRSCWPPFQQPVSFKHLREHRKMSYTKTILLVHLSQYCLDLLAVILKDFKQVFPNHSWRCQELDLRDSVCKPWALLGTTETRTKESREIYGHRWAVSFQDKARLLLSFINSNRSCLFLFSVRTGLFIAWKFTFITTLFWTH